MATDLLELTSEAPPQKPLSPVELRTRRDMTLVSRAIDNETKNLDKLAKNNREAGYGQESRVIEGDVAALKYQIAPAFREQQEIPFATPANLASGVVDQLRDVVEKARATKMSTEALLGELGRRVGRYATAVADAAYEAGYADRQQSSATIASRVLRQLSARPDEDNEG